jgi:hypothetical protein
MLIGREELKFVVYSFLLIGGLVSIPYVWGYLTEPEDYTFTWIIKDRTAWESISDFMNQAQRGEYLFTTHHTSERIPNVFFNPVFLSAGLFSKLLGVSNITGYTILLLLSTFVFMVALYRFLSIYFESEYHKKVAFLIVIFSSGLGYIVWIALKLFGSPFFFSEDIPMSARIFPMDMVASDTNVFLTLHSFNLHHTTALCFILGIFYYFIKSFGEKRYMGHATILTFVLGTFHPYDVITIYLAFGFFVLLNREKTAPYLRFVLLSSPPILYTFYVFMISSFSMVKSATWTFFSPNIYSYIIGYGIPFFLAMYYVFKKKEHDKRTQLLILWIAAGLALAYAPYDMQRRFIMGLSMPISILATIAIVNYFPKWSSGKYLFLLILLLMPSNVLWIAKETYKVDQHQDLFGEYYYYVHDDDLEAVQWLGKNTEVNDITLTNAVIGGFAVSKISHRVYLGEMSWTAYFSAKNETYYSFWRGEIDRFEFLKGADISYIYYGSKEREIGSFSPETLPYLEKVFENDHVMIYEVTG